MGENYWEAYAPVANFISVRTLMIFSILHDLETRSIDFTLAFPQADLDMDLFMELPAIFGLGSDSRKYVIKLNKSMYGLKQVVHNWFELLKSSLESRDYDHQIATDPCVFIKKDSIVLVYADNCLIFSRKNSGISDKFIHSLTHGKENFEFTDEGDLSKYLGVDIVKKKDSSIECTQPHLIERFLKLVDQDQNINVRPTSVLKLLLHKDLQGFSRKHSWNYRQAVEFSTYLQGTTRPDISMATH